MNRSSKQLFIGLTASSFLVLAACRDKAPPEPPTTTGAGVTGNGTTSNQNAPIVTPGATTPMATSTTGNRAADMSGATALSDAQVLQVTHFANVGEIAQAKLAQDKSKNADVKKFAQMMLAQHTDADKKGSDLVKKENITLADSPVSTGLKTDADKLTDDMRSKTGADFDKAYIDAQVTEHQTVLDSLDTKLIPAARDADVKAYLQDVRKAVSMHLNHARTLQSQLK